MSIKRLFLTAGICAGIAVLTGCSEPPAKVIESNPDAMAKSMADNPNLSPEQRATIKAHIKDHGATSAAPGADAAPSAPGSGTAPSAPGAGTAPVAPGSGK